MSFGHRIVEKLQMMQRMEDQISFSVRAAHEEKGYHLTESDGPIELSLIVPDMDKYSFMVSRFEMRHRDWTSKLPVKEQLRRQAEWVEQSVTYLPERFALIELDEVNNVAQIRSRVPTWNSDARQYYELLLKQGTDLILNRYEIRVGSDGRQPVPFLLTEDVLPRLIDDLAGVWRI